MRRGARDQEAALEAHLEASADALEAGRPADALASAEAAGKVQPRSVPALHFRAAALTELGRLEEAEAVYRDALAIDGDDPETLLGIADLLVSHLGEERESLERGLAAAQRGIKLAQRRRLSELEGELSLLEGTALNQLGESRAALTALDRARSILGEDVDALLERGIALFELLRFDDAREQLERVLAIAPEEAWAHHYLGLIDERRGDARRAEKHLARARKLAPEDFPPAVTLTPEAFDRAVEDALGKLPEKVSQYLSNVAITVDDVPADDDLAGSEPPLSPTILGVFRGSPWRDKGTFDPWAHFPSSIVLYQKNLERCARDLDDLIEQIGITLIHEVGHFLGLDEEQLRERGLD
jgi:predicted Zn-dependent protease with MMP-like domain/Flp pilus assembly protein TadD